MIGRERNASAGCKNVPIAADHQHCFDGRLADCGSSLVLQLIELAGEHGVFAERGQMANRGQATLPQFLVETFDAVVGEIHR